MSEQTISGYMAIPRVPSRGGSARLIFITPLLDAVGEKAGFILQAPKTGTISKVGFRTGTVTTGDTVDVRLESVDLATGNPSGTLLGTNSNGSQVIANADDNTWFLTSLTQGVVVTKGDFIAVVIVNGGGGGNLRIAHLGLVMWGGNFSYITDFVGGAWAKDDESPLCALEYSDGSYAHSPGVYPVSDIDVMVSFDNTSDPDHRGLKFKLPFPFRITGIWVVGDFDGPVDVKLYDSDGTTVLETMSLDPDVRAATGGMTYFVLFSGTQSLLKNTFYRVVLEPTSAVSVELDEFDVDTVAIMDALEGGQDFHYTEKKDAGWTDTTTKRPFMGILIDGVNIGMLVHPGMAGGMRA